LGNHTPLPIKALTSPKYHKYQSWRSFLSFKSTKRHHYLFLGSGEKRLWILLNQPDVLICDLPSDVLKTANPVLTLPKRLVNCRNQTSIQFTHVVTGLLSVNQLCVPQSEAVRVVRRRRRRHFERNCSGFGAASGFT
jgi:hypothetical protein